MTVLRGSTQQPTETDANIHSQALEGHCVLIWKILEKGEGIEGSSNPIGRPTELPEAKPPTICWSKAAGIYVAKECHVCPQYKRMHLIL